MSLYNKYRPKSFDEIKGNKTTLATLTGWLNDGKNIPHAFLFYGPTGCGKTTIARILANKLGAEGHDIQEIDTADFRGIDTVRALRSNSGLAPMSGGTSRVAIIDEVHKMTGDAQNAFLKELEDPPEHMYYILCTTDPQNLLSTIRNRCSQFQVELLQQQEAKEIIKEICKKEGKKLKKPVIEQIINSAQGHGRNLVQILDSVLQLPEEEQIKAAKQYEQGEAQVIDLCRALVRTNNWAEVSKLLVGIKNAKISEETARRTVLGYCQAILLKSDNVKVGLIMDYFIDPFYNSGFPGLVHACYSICKSKG